MKNVHAFDFDGTITNRDTLIEFIKYARGKTGTITGFMLYSPLLIMMKLKLYPNYKAKQKIFSHFFKGTPIDEFNRICQDFAKTRTDVMRPEAVNRIRQLLMKGDRVVVVSASIDNWVKPFFTGIEQETGTGITVLGTRVDTENDILTGRFATPNCYGKEKVRRLEAILPDRKHIILIAYGDSRGDKEMFEYADKKHFKPFK